ncbi:MAG: caspase family protein [Desulfovibrionaceae bacterium]
MNKRLFSGLLLTACCLLAAPLAHASDAKCRMADKFAGDAAKTMATDKAEGLKLFIMAQEACPANPAHNYNLGIAYYAYGTLDKAKEMLQQAAKLEPKNDKYNNALAWVLLDTNADPQRALKLAKTVAGNAPSESAFSDTLIRAYQANGMLREAMNAAAQAHKRWPSDSGITKRHQEMEDAYLAHYLGLGQQGKIAEALSGLEYLKDSPKAAVGRCWLLHKSGKTEDALALARSAAARMGTSYKPLKTVFSELLGDYIQAQYAQFQAGQRYEAADAIEVMRAKYPSTPELDEAYKKMYQAFKTEAKTIDIPAPVRATAGSGGGGQADALLQSIAQGGARQEVADLVSDVDREIPQGRDARPHAIAVVIGNKNYKSHGNGIPDVAFADRDAGFMRKYLVEAFGYDAANVIYEQDATQGTLRKIFGTPNDPKGKLADFVRPGESDVFIYYSGHGAPDLKEGRAFIVPVDADVSYIANNGFGMDVFYDNLAKIPARSVTVVMDACFSGNYAEGTLVKNVSPVLLKTTNPVRKLPNAVVFSSTGQGQVSHWYPKQGHGMFTYFFLKGISGAADEDKNKRVTVAEMKKYLAEKVSYQARRDAHGDQTPVTMSGLAEDTDVIRLK